MKARQKTSKPVDDRPAWRRGLLWAVGGLFSVCLFIMIGVGLWFQNSLNQFKELERRTRTAYAELNEEFPFKVAAGSPAVSEARLDAYFRVRDRVVRAIPAKVDSLTADLIRSGAIRRFDLVRGFSTAFDPISRAATAHLDGLRSEAMSLDEYLWLHGLIVREIYREGDSRRADLDRVVAGLDRIFQSSDWIEDGDFSAENFARGLDITYEGVGSPPRGSLASMDLSKTTACVIDVLAANHTSAVRARDNPESGI